jgi:hypothetical protein
MGLIVTPQPPVFDGTNLIIAPDSTSGQALVPYEYFFKLAADGSAIGAAIADYFGSNSSFPTVASAIYRIDFYLFFLKSTAGTVTWTLTNSGTYNNVAVCSLESASAGSSAGNSQEFLQASGTTAAFQIGTTGSLADAVNHATWIRAIVEIANAGNLRLRATESAGTITPLRGSHYTVKRLPAGNIGTFVA